MCIPSKVTSTSHKVIIRLTTNKDGYPVKVTRLLEKSLEQKRNTRHQRCNKLFKLINSPVVPHHTDMNGHWEDLKRSPSDISPLFLHFSSEKEVPISILSLFDSTTWSEKNGWQRRRDGHWTLNCGKNDVIAKERRDVCQFLEKEKTKTHFLLFWYFLLHDMMNVCFFFVISFLRDFTISNRFLMWFFLSHSWHQVNLFLWINRMTRELIRVEKN